MCIILSVLVAPTKYDCRQSDKVVVGREGEGGGGVKSDKKILASQRCFC